MTRLERILTQKKKSGEKIFCGYVTLGYPTRSFTEQLIPALEHAGVDVLELGVPFSDPLADGPIIQHAAHVSLTGKTQVHDAFDMVKRLRKKGVTMPIVFFTYYNILLHKGIDRCARMLADSGFDGVICPDLPLEEDKELRTALAKENIALVSLIAPTSQTARIKTLARKSSGFIYYVSRRGVTGVQKTMAADTTQVLTTIMRSTRKPVLVGFGVSTPAQIRTLCKVGDGVIVGSALIEKITETKNVAQTARYVHSLVRAVKE